ncbi:hypothetical protein MsAg5_12480 [Methanosarcinaceae archaeon Ag5]|uniref:GLUG domain-containing protein n=1 Tax=Methanolapillus africanus TaxID=3028297 RepID=A0AAE4MKQ7_9EURY|nr:hypothetical protein [Methanosarcinaceae archaeon Ag5]
MVSDSKNNKKKILIALLLLLLLALLFVYVVNVMNDDGPIINQNETNMTNSTGMGFAIDTSGSTSEPSSTPITPAAEPLPPVIVTPSTGGRPSGNNQEPEPDPELDPDPTKPPMDDIDDYIDIENFEQLKAVGETSDSLSKKYRLVDDIDMTGKVWVPLGRNSSTGYFNGTFNGNGYVITGLTTVQDANENNGLFGVVGSSGTVKNVALIDVNIDATSNTTGAVAGRVDGTVVNCYVTGNVTGTSHVGGIAGGVGYGSNSGTIRNCYTICNVSGSLTAPDGEEIGGIAGRVTNGEISNCYATGNVTGRIKLGGIAGNVFTIDQNVSSNVALMPLINAVSNQNFPQRIIGALAGAVTADSNLASETLVLKNNTTPNIPPADGTNLDGTGKPDADFVVQTTYTDIGWKFFDGTVDSTNPSYPDTVWKMPESGFKFKTTDTEEWVYPVFYWQVSAA